MAYRDLRHFLQVLDEKGLLHHVHAEVDKDWEIAAVSKRTFQRYPAAQRKALYFHKVKGSDVPIVAGVLGANRDVYAACLGTDQEHIFEVWSRGEHNPIPPQQVATGPCQEVVLLGEQADLNQLPIPIWTVEHDGGPYITSPYCITVDPDSGENNVGTYRLQLKGPRKLGLYLNSLQDAYQHLMKNEQAGVNTPMCVALGSDPTVGLCAVAKFAYGVDEYAVSGGLRGEALPVCLAKTVPLLVPSTSEIIIEGYVLAGVREHEGPFGEYHGFMGAAGDNFVFEVTAITHRKNPIYQAFISEMPPSESSVIRGTGRDLPMLHHLKNVLRLPVVDLHLSEAGGGAAWCTIAIKRNRPGIVPQVMNAAWGFAPLYSKWLVVVDEDIDVHDYFQVQWAMSWMVRPDKDFYFQSNTATVALDPANAPHSVPGHHPSRWIASKVCVDATRKHEYPPKAVPPQEHMQRVDSQWEKYGFDQ